MILRRLRGASERNEAVLCGNFGFSIDHNFRNGELGCIRAEALVEYTMFFEGIVRGDRNA